MVQIAKAAANGKIAIANRLAGELAADLCDIGTLLKKIELDCVGG